MKKVVRTIPEQMAAAFKSHTYLAFTFLTAIATLGAGISPSHAQVCDAELVNALKTRIHNYDRLVETRTLSTHYCNSSSSTSAYNLGGMVDAMPVGGSVNRQSMQQACMDRNETYLLDHHKEFEMSYLPDAALEVCKGGLTFKAQRTSDEQWINVNIGYVPTDTAKFAKFDSFVYPKNALSCPDLPKRNTTIYRDSIKFTCKIIDRHQTINLTLKTKKNASKTLSIPRAPVKDTKWAQWSFTVGCGHMGSCFQCENEFGIVGPMIQCAVSNDPCRSGRDYDGSSRKRYCAARFYRSYTVIDRQYAVIDNLEEPIGNRPTIIALPTPSK